jgi:DNA-binding transcriptional MerR regulator
LKLIADHVIERRYTISQLSKQSGVSVASIKFYLREGLLAAGDLSAEKRAYYQQQHVQRLLLIRALRELAALSIEQVGRVIAKLDHAEPSPFELIAATIDALAPARKLRGSARVALRDRIHKKLRQRGLTVRKDSATLDGLAQALLGLRVFMPTLDADVLDVYLDALVPLAEAEFGANEARILAGPESALTGAIVGTVLFEPMIVALRRLAHEHFAKRLYARAARPRRT